MWLDQRCNLFREIFFNATNNYSHGNHFEFESSSDAQAGNTGTHVIHNVTSLLQREGNVYQLSRSDNL